MKPFTIHYRRRGTTLLLHAKVYSDSLSGATVALMEFEHCDGYSIDILNGMEAGK